jgi:hypothetical protein
MLNLFKKGKRKEQFVLRLARLVKQNMHEKKRDPTGLAGGVLRGTAGQKPMRFKPSSQRI